VGLITTLLTLPLAPVRGTVWLAEMIQAEAEKEHYDESALLSSLAELETLRESGELSEEEIDDAENELLERLIEIRGFGEQEMYGGT
jgi:hypothetical protein